MTHELARPQIGRRLGLGFARSLILICVVAAPAAADSESEAWSSSLDESGVTVHSRLATDDAPAAFSASAHVDAEPREVLAILSDVERFPEWMSRTSEARLLERRGENDVVIYTRKKTPWPLNDRDVVLRTTTRIEAAGDEILLTLYTTQSPEAAEEPGLVRIPHFVGHYRLTRPSSRGAAGTRVEYEAEIDMGGNIPDWVSRWVVRQMPLRTLLGLRRQVEITSRDSRSGPAP